MDQKKLDYIVGLKGKLNDTGIRREIRRVFGVKKSQGNDIFIKIFGTTEKVAKTKEKKPDTKRATKKATFNVKNGQGTAESSDPTIRSLEDLVAACNIDLAHWKCRKFTANSYGDNFQAKGEFEPKRDEKAFAALLEQFLQETKNHAPKRFDLVQKKLEGEHLYILNIQDPHLGKLASNSETNWGNYDLKIAKDYYSEAVDDLLSKAPINAVGTVILVCGSDLLHFDTEQVTTTAGTRLDSDSRWSKVFNEGCKLIAETVEKLASKFKVEVMMVYGNHGKVSEYALGAYIKAFFRNHPNVNVNNEPLDRKYYGFGRSLIGFTHGNEVKLAELPLIMMRENQTTISKYDQFFVLTGHIHQDKVTEIKGVKIMICPALCPPDKYHSEHGYVGNIQTSQGLLFADWGLSSVVYSKPPAKVI